MSKTPTSSRRYNDIVCIGIGISGICLGAQLKRKWNFTDVHLYDRNESFGGTWLVNKYPGVACDVPTILYSYSFDRNEDTSRIFASGPNIQTYLSTVVDKYELRPRLTFSTNWLSATWDESRHLWVVQLQNLKTGETFIHECRVLYSAIGLLNTAKAPDIPGLETFKGPVVHTFTWPDVDVDMTDKNVVVIGNGCTATQVIPAILPTSKSITQFFRHAQYYFPIKNRPYQGFLKWGLEHIPGYPLFIRAALYFILEDFGRGFMKDKKGNKIRARRTEECITYLKRAAPERYHDILTPEYPLGCKRRICDDEKTGYFHALHSEKVYITKDPIAQITPEGVRTADNKVYPADVIITAIGFDTSSIGFSGLDIVGRGGKSLHEYWKEVGAPTAYNTACLPGFPNFFILLGPNSSSGHTSAILSIENVVNYSMKLINPIILSKRSFTVEVKPEAAQAFCDELDKANENLVVGDTPSLYMLNGKNRGVYPWTYNDYWIRTAFPKWKDLTYVHTPNYPKSIHFRRRLMQLMFASVVFSLFFVFIKSLTAESRLSNPGSLRKYISIHWGS